MKHFFVCLLLGLLATPAAATTPLPPPPDSLKALLQQARGPARYRALVRVMQAFKNQLEPAAAAYAAEVIPLAQRQRDTLSLALAYQAQGATCLLMHQEDQAERYLSQATKLLDHMVASNTDRANLLVDWGVLAYNRLQAQQARRYFRQAQVYFRRANDAGDDALAYRRMSMTFRGAGETDSMVFCLLQARRMFQQANNLGGVASTNVDMALQYNHQHRYAEALQYGREALDYQVQHHQEAEQYYTLETIGQSLLSMNRLQEALPYLRQAYRRTQQIGEDGMLLMIDRQMEEAFLQLHQLDSANYHASRAYRVAQHTQVPDAKAALGDALAGLATVRLAQHRPAEARALAARSVAFNMTQARSGQSFLRNRLTFSLETAREVAGKIGDYRWSFRLVQAHDSLKHLTAQETNQKLLAEMRVRLQTAEAEQKVVLLEKEAHLAAQQRELAELRRRQQVLALALVAVLAVAALVGSLRYARQRQRRREEALRRKLAADLHDDVGSLLTRISLESSLLDEGLATPAEQHALRANLVGMSQQALRQMGDVVWSIDDQHDSLPALLDRMREHGYDLLPAAGLELDFEAPAAVAQATLPAAARQHLYLIYKEALHNAVKHAQGARTVRVRLAVEGRTLRLRVQDDGPGTASPGRPDGHGLANMRRRAEAVGGRVQYDTAPGAGFAVSVELPLA
ncbi:MAG: ATP-binding protein [Janthinobacterium lividum]